MILFNYFTSISASPLLINCQFQHNNLNLEKCFKCSARVAAWERGEGRGIWSRIQTQHLGCGTWEVLVLHSSTEHLLHFQHCSSQCWNCWRLCIGTISGGCLRSVLFLSSCWVWHFIHWLLFFTSFPRCSPPMGLLWSCQPGSVLESGFSMWEDLMRVERWVVEVICSPGAIPLFDSLWKPSTCY